MRTCDPDALRPGGGRDLEPAFDIQRQVELRDLITLRQVRIHVVLAVELRVRRYFAIERQAGDHRELDGALVRHRQRTGKAEAPRTHERVRWHAAPLLRADRKKFVLRLCYVL